MSIYARLGVLYYLVYNSEFWQRDGHQPFEVYKLVEGEYQLQIGEPYWMGEVGLGIGRCRTVFGNLLQEQLAWFNEWGDRYPSEADRAATKGTPCSTTAGIGGRPRVPALRMTASPHLQFTTNDS